MNEVAEAALQQASVVEKTLSVLDLETLTPRAALDMLFEWKHLLTPEKEVVPEMKKI